MPDAVRSPRIATLVVTYNSADVLPGLLEALPAAFGGAGPAELVVADNGSADGTLDVVARLAPAATVVALGRNAGYAAGINAGLQAAAPSDAVLVLNPDTRPRPGSIAPLAHALDHDRVGIAVPRLLAPDGVTAPSLRRDPTVLRALGEAVLGGRRAGRFAALGEVVWDPHRYERQGPVDWATGAAWLVSSRCLEEVGPWDESFFLYSEETDFALRARAAGWRVWYVPEALVEHIGGDAPTSPALWALLTANRVRLYARAHGRLRGAAFRAAVTLGAALRAARGSRTNRAALRALVPGRGPPDARKPGDGVT